MSTESKKKKNSLIQWVVLFILMLLVVSLGKGIFELLSVYDRVEMLANEVVEVEQKNEELKNTLEERKSQSYVERQIRENLHMAKEGEVVVVLPEIKQQTKQESGDAEQLDVRENWRKWWEVWQ